LKLELTLAAGPGAIVVPGSGSSGCFSGRWGFKLQRCRRLMTVPSSSQPWLVRCRRLISEPSSSQLPN